MMKKTRWIELFYNIRHTLVSFIAVVLFVALATALFTGIKWTKKGVGASVEKEYTDGNLHHFALNYPYGFDEAFVTGLVKDGIVQKADGIYETYRNFQLNDKRCQARVVSLTETIDRPYVLEGELPASSGEAAVKAYWAEQNGVKIGDSITLKNDGTGNELLTDTFRITGLVGAAEYMGKFADGNGPSPLSPTPVNVVLFVSKDSMNVSAFGGYTRVAAQADALSGLTTGTAAYENESDRISAELTKAVEPYVKAKNAEMTEKAERFGLSAPEYQATVESRLVNVSFSGIQSVMDTFGKMQYSLVALFVVIGVLICYSTVSRLVYDQTTLIGTKKAVGFTTKDIVVPFLLYSGLASALGSLLGTLAGRFFVEPVLIDSVKESYRFHRTVYYFGLWDSLFFALVQLVLILITALVASVSISKKPALKLLSGETEETKIRDPEKWPFFRRLSFLNKTIVLNFLKDKRRVFATLVGIIGCTALVVSALSMYNNLVGSFTRNMEKVSQYDTMVYFSGDEETKEKLIELFRENGLRYSETFRTNGVMQTPEGEGLVTELYVSDSPEFHDLYHLYDLSSGNECIPQNGVWVNAAYKRTFHAKKGDTLYFTDASGQKRGFPVEGIFEFTLLNYQIVLPRALYEEAFGTEYRANAFMVQAGEKFDLLSEAALPMEPDLRVTDYYSVKKSTLNSIAVIARAVVFLYVALSAVLSVLLLFNLFTMFVSEKKRELITLMMNGFSRKDAEKYIYADVRFLCVIGIVLGLILGVVMGGVSLESFNNHSTYFLNRINVPALLIGAAFTAVLTHVMCRLALRKVKGFELADINKM